MSNIRVDVQHERSARAMAKTDLGRELVTELSAAVLRTGEALAGILGDAGRKSGREVVELAHEGREILAGTLRASADELRRRR
ncbi:hypothetical protein [Nocardia lasii]|uniref:Uncharacterized protein n=1 Tax=Nocardia lasii TaxID=1616107 RepID=A0ABW1JMT0_9NOCA